MYLELKVSSCLGKYDNTDYNSNILWCRYLPFIANERKILI